MASRPPEAGKLVEGKGTESDDGNFVWSQRGQLNGLKVFLPPGEKCTSCAGAK